MNLELKATRGRYPVDLLDLGRVGGDDRLVRTFPSEASRRDTEGADNLSSCSISPSFLLL